MNRFRITALLSAGIFSLATLTASLSFAGQARYKIPQSLFSAFGVEAGSQRIESVVLPDLSGKMVVSDKLSGKLTLLVFWASWCVDCRREMPTLAKLYQQFQDKGLHVLAVDLMEPPEIPRAFQKRFSLDFPILLDLTGEVGRRFGLHAIPAIYLLDGQNRIIGRMVGFHDWTSPQAIRLVDALLGDTDSPKHSTQ